MPLSKQELAKLCALRRTQFFERELTDEEKQIFFALCEKEQSKGATSLRGAEKMLYLFLTRKQTDSVGWTPALAKILLELQG